MSQSITFGTTLEPHQNSYFDPSKHCETAVLQSPWHTVHTYCSETDTLSIYLATATAGLIVESDEVLPGLLVDYTADMKIVAMEIWQAKHHVPAHFRNAAEVHEGKPPLQLQQDFDAQQQQFSISFLDNASRTKLVATDDERITVWENAGGKWTSIIFSHAYESLSLPLLGSSK